MILASDGQCNHLSSEDTVHAVARWIESVKNNTLTDIGDGTPISVCGGPAVNDYHPEDISFWEYWRTRSEFFFSWG
jgi:hypothetical protein